MQSTIKDLFLDKKKLDPNNDAELEKLVAILKKPSYKREEDELGALYHIINNNSLFVDFLNQMPEETCISLLTSFKHVQMSRAQEVFRIGDTAKFFYLILKGSVYIMVPMQNDLMQLGQSGNKADLARGVTIDLPPKKIKQQANNQKKPPQNTQISIPKRRDSQAPRSSLNSKDKDTSGMKSNDNTTNFYEFNENEALTIKELNYHYPNYTVVNILKQGDHFGEIALSLRTFRTATVVCREPCYFMVLNSSAYYRILNDYQDTVQQELFNFLKACPLMRNWPSENIVGLMRHTTVVRAKRNNVIYDFGDPTGVVYIIRHGDVEIIKEAEIEMENDEIFKKTSHTRHPFHFNKERLMTMNPIWKKQYEQIKKQYIRVTIFSKNKCYNIYKVAVLGPGQYFGEEETSLRLKERVSKAVVRTQTVEMIMIPTTKIIENAKDPTAFYLGLCNHNVKKDWREKFEHVIVDTNIQNDTKVKTKKKESMDEPPLFVPISSLDGILKTAGTKKNKNSISTFDFSSEPRSALPMIEGIDNEFNTTESSPKSSGVFLMPEKHQSSHTIESAQLPHGWDMVIENRASGSKQESNIPRSNKLWEVNINRHKRKILKKAKKDEATPTSNKKFSTNTSSDFSSSKAEKAKYRLISQKIKEESSAERKLPTELSKTTSTLTSNLLRLRNGITSALIPGFDSLRGQNDEYEMEATYQKMVNKKLGGLLEGKKEPESSSKVPVQLFINTRENYFGNAANPANTSKSQNSSWDHTTFSSLSHLAAKVHSNANMSNLSPMLIKKLKSQMKAQSTKKLSSSPLMRKESVNEKERATTLGDFGMYPRTRIKLRGLLQSGTDVKGL